MKAMNTDDTRHPFSLECKVIAQKLNSLLLAESWISSIGIAVVTLYNGICFKIYYKSGTDYGFIYVHFNGRDYNYSDLYIRQDMFNAMQAWLKERRQDADDGESF